MTFFTSTFRNVKKTLKRDTLATLIMFIFCLAKFAASHVWYLPPLNSKLRVTAHISFTIWLLNETRSRSYEKITADNYAAINSSALIGYSNFSNQSERSNSAKHRFTLEISFVGTVPVRAITGLPLIYWSQSMLLIWRHLFLFSASQQCLQVRRGALQRPRVGQICRVVWKGRRRLLRGRGGVQSRVWEAFRHGMVSGFRDGCGQ